MQQTKRVITLILILGILIISYFFLQSDNVQKTTSTKSNNSEDITIKPKIMDTNWGVPEFPVSSTQWTPIAIQDLADLNKTIIIDDGVEEKSYILAGQAYIFEENSVSAGDNLLNFDLGIEFMRELQTLGWTTATISSQEYTITPISAVHPASQSNGYIKIIGDSVREIVVSTTVMDNNGKLYVSGSACPCNKKTVIFVSDPFDIINPNSLQ